MYWNLFDKDWNHVERYLLVRPVEPAFIKEQTIPLNITRKVKVMAYDAFFFDFDGVLADSVEMKSKAFAKIFESYGPRIQSMVVDHHRKNGGMTRKEKFRHYYAEFLNRTLENDEMQGLCNLFSSLVVDAVVSCPEIPGVTSFLERWHKRVPCFVVSATPDDEIEIIEKKRGLGDYFQKVLGSERSKRDNVKMILDKYKINPQKSLFFGDAESDYRAARMCHVDFIGIVPGNKAPLLQIAPDIKWAPNFNELRL